MLRSVAVLLVFPAEMLKRGHSVQFMDKSEIVWETSFL